MGFLLVGVAMSMLGLAYAAVPLYKMFCQQTGFGGATQQAIALPTRQEKRLIRVRFNADINRELPWLFQPLQQEIVVKAGEVGLAFYRAENKSNEPVLGMATYNVTPEKAGIYFNKVECFCFIEQRLEPKQVVDMPVQFFIDPDIVNDPNLSDVSTITLSYTFFRLKTSQ
ncbi:MAG: cytochrome c oxidase assembly protein [Alphaproteobacteria bacterium]